MKQKLILTIILSISFLTISSFGQLIKLGIGGGYTALTGDNSLTAENALNLNSGYHYGAKLVVGIPLFPIQFTGGYYENKLSNDESGVTSETEFSTFGLGVEWAFLPGPINPYIETEILFTSFGETKYSFEGNDYSGDIDESKTGLGLGAGVYFKLIPVIDLDLSLRYNMNTLFSSGDAMNSTNVRLNILFSVL